MTSLYPSIKASYRWTPDKMLIARKYHFRQTCRPAFRFLIHFLVIMSGLFGVIILSAQGLSLKLLLFFLIPLYWYLIRPMTMRWQVAEMFKKLPEGNLELNWIFGESEIKSICELGESIFSWDALTKVVETPEGLLFYTTPETFYWIPKSAFSLPSDMQHVISMAKNREVKLHKTT